MVATGEGAMGRKDWETGISRCKLSYIRKKPKPTVEAGRSIKRRVVSLSRCEKMVARTRGVAMG